MQIVYGVVYTLLTLTGQGVNESAHQYHQKKVAVNLFGLVGTGILIGLYVILLSCHRFLQTTRQKALGCLILAKGIEVFTIIGIVYLMRLEKRQLYWPAKRANIVSNQSINNYHGISFTLAKT